MTDAALDLKGAAPESWICVDCGLNTTPGFRRARRAGRRHQRRSRGAVRLAAEVSAMTTHKREPHRAEFICARWSRRSKFSANFARRIAAQDFRSVGAPEERVALGRYAGQGADHPRRHGT